MNRFVVKSHFDLPCVEITGVRLVLGKKRKGSTDFKAHKGASVEPLGSRLGLFYLSKVIDLKFFFRLDFEPVLQVCLYIKGKLGVGVCRVLVLWMLRQIVLLGVERADALHLDDAAAGGHDSQLIHAHQFNAVTESDLMALAQKDTDSQTVTPTAPSEPEPAAPAEPEEPSEPETSEPEPEQPAPKSNNSMMFLVIVAALAAGGLGYYFKVYKPKHDLDDAEDIDDFEFEGPEEPTVNEDEEATGEDAGQEELSEEEEAEQRRLYEEDNEDIPIEGDDDLVF